MAIRQVEVLHKYFGSKRERGGEFEKCLVANPKVGVTQVHGAKIRLVGHAIMFSRAKWVGEGKKGRRKDY